MGGRLSQSQRQQREGDCPNRSGCQSSQKMPTKSRGSIPRETRPQMPSARRQMPGASRPTHCGWDIRPPITAFFNVKGRAIVPIAAAARAAKKCRPSPEDRYPAKPGNHCPTPEVRPQMPGASRPTPCGWDIRPPVTAFPDVKGRAIVPIAAAARAAKKCRPSSEDRYPAEPGTHCPPRDARRQTPNARRLTPDALRMGHPPSHNCISRRQREGDCPNRSGCQSSQKIPTKSRSSIPRETRHPLPDARPQMPGASRPTPCGWDIRPPVTAFFNVKGRAIVPIAAAARAAKKCRPSPEDRYPAEPGTQCPTPDPKPQMPGASRPTPCGWDIRPPITAFPDVNGRAIVPIAAVGRPSSCSRV